MFSIDNFRTKGLVYGGTRPSMFQVEIDYPEAIRSVEGNSSSVFAYDSNSNQYQISKDAIIEKFKHLCHVSSLPGTRTSIPVRMNYLGRSFNFAGDKTYTTFATTIYNDEDFLIRNALEIWLDRISDTFRIGKSTSNLYADDYKVKIKINQYSKNGQLIKDYNLFNCFPLSISEIPLNYNNNNISDFTVDWIYDYFTTNYYEITSGDGIGTTSTITANKII